VDVDWGRPCISHSADPDDVTTTLERVNLETLVIAERAALVRFVVSGVSVLGWDQPFARPLRNGPLPPDEVEDRAKSLVE
jgi:hypothetical protein